MTIIKLRAACRYSCHLRLLTLPSVGIHRWSGRELSFPLINTCLLVTPRQPPCRSPAHFVTPFLLRDLSTFRQLEQQTQATSACLCGKKKNTPEPRMECLAPCPASSAFPSLPQLSLPQPPAGCPVLPGCSTKRQCQPSPLPPCALTLSAVTPTV